MTPADAREVLLKQPWRRETKRDEWLRQQARDIGISYSAAWGILYQRRKRLWAEEQELLAAYSNQLNQAKATSQRLEKSYERLAERAARLSGHDNDGPSAARADEGPHRFGEPAQREGG